ncbi:hypothetical protein T15_1952 [Streptococcus suis T15]|nr:hypothetical protein T15_1952 [Streptococcus suis T15]
MFVSVIIFFSLSYFTHYIIDMKETIKDLINNWKFPNFPTIYSTVKGA